MQPTEVYYGTREALQAEVALLPCYSEKYQIAAFGPNGEEFTPEGAPTKAVLRAILAEYRAAYPDARFVWVA